MTWFFTGVTLFFAPASFPQRNAITAPRNLDQLVSESQTVVQGHITEVVLEPHPTLKNLMTLRITLQTEDALKGQPGSSYTFRQAVLERRDMADRMGYHVGDHVLLILMAPNRYGLSSPAGLEQGRFLITPRTDGTLQIQNRFGNAGLFRGLQADMAARGLAVSPEVKEMVSRGGGPAPLNTMKSLMRSLAAQQ